MKRIKSLALVVLLQTSLAVYADEIGLKEEFSACMEKSEGVTADMLDCMAAETKRQDERLNNVYKELMSKLNPQRKKQLQEVQRLWIKYRDGNCSFYADPEGGTAATVSSSDCVMRMTTERAEELEGSKEAPGLMKTGETNTETKSESNMQGGSKYETKKFEKEYGKCAPPEDLDCASISIQYIEITESASKAASDSVNNFIKKSLLKWGEEDPKSFEELANQLFQEYKSSNEGFDNPIGWSLEKNVEIIYNTQKILSLSISDYQFTGGAHPNSFMIYANFNMTTGEQIKLSDILINGYEANLNAIGEKKFRELKEMEPNQSLEDAGFWFENNKFGLNDNFAITKTGLIFFYNSYEIAPYVAGPTELELDYEEIKALIKRDGLLAENEY